ncbi:MAG: hypothetical protein ABJN36_10545 [Cyclobacteriaceae bacterium]
MELPRSSDIKKLLKTKKVTQAQLAEKWSELRPNKNKKHRPEVSNYLNSQTFIGELYCLMAVSQLTKIPLKQILFPEDQEFSKCENCEVLETKYQSLETKYKLSKDLLLTYMESDI